MRIEPRTLTREELPEVWRYVRELTDSRAELLRGHIAAIEAENKQLRAVEQAAREIVNYGGGNGDDDELTISRRLMFQLGDALHSYRRLR